MNNQANNQSEIIRLTVRRDLDIPVAERLMGWQHETDQAKICRLNQYIRPDFQWRWLRTSEGGWDINSPPYSSNLVGETLMMAICKASLATIELPNRSGTSPPMISVGNLNSL